MTSRASRRRLKALMGRSASRSSGRTFHRRRKLPTPPTWPRRPRHAGVKHVIWSTLEDTRKWVPLSDNRMPTLQGKYKVPHFDAKGEADEQFTKLGLPLTFLLAIVLLGQRHLLWHGPAEGRGRQARAHASDGRQEAGRHCGRGYRQVRLRHLQERQRSGSARPWASPANNSPARRWPPQYAKALGEPVSYNAVSWDAYRGFGFPGAEDLGNMFQFYCDFEEYFCGARSLDTSRSLNPALQNLTRGSPRTRAAFRSSRLRKQLRYRCSLVKARPASNGPGLCALLVSGAHEIIHSQVFGYLPVVVKK